MVLWRCRNWNCSLYKSSNRPLLSFFFKATSSLTIFFASPDRRICPITLTGLCNLDPSRPHFYIIKLGVFRGIYYFRILWIFGFFDYFISFFVESGWFDCLAYMNYILKQKYTQNAETYILQRSVYLIKNHTTKAFGIVQYIASRRHRWIQIPSFSKLTRIRIECCGKY